MWNWRIFNLCISRTNGLNSAMNAILFYSKSKMTEPQNWIGLIRSCEAFRKKGGIKVKPGQPAQHAKEICRLNPRCSTQTWQDLWKKRILLNYIHIILIKQLPINESFFSFQLPKSINYSFHYLQKTKWNQLLRKQTLECFTCKLKAFGFNSLVPRVQKIKIRNLTLNRLLIVEFVKKMAYLGAQGLMG